MYVSGKLPTYPSPNLMLTLTFHFGQNVRLREGVGGPIALCPLWLVQVITLVLVLKELRHDILSHFFDGLNYG